MSRLTPFSPAPFLILTLTAVLTACGGGGEGGGSAGTDPDEQPDAGPKSVEVSGRVQKGPFRQLQVTATALDQQGRPVSTLPVEVSGDRYAFQATEGMVYQVQATGEFEDELTGERVQLQQPLSAVTVADTQPQNINVLTDLSSAQFFGSLEPDKPLSSQIGETEKNLMQQLGFAAGTDPGLLDLTDIPDNAELDDPNLSLLLLSGSVMSLPRQGGRMPEGYSGLVESLRQGLAPETVLPAFAGLDAADLYQRIKERNVISNLPDLVLNPGNSFICNPDCGWIFETEPSLSVTNVSVREATGQADIVVRRSGGVLTDLPAFSVTVTAESLSATDGLDFVGRSETLNFSAGQRQQAVTLPLLIDALAEGNETFRVTLGAPSIEVDVRRSEALITVLDDLPTPDETATGQLTLVDACLIGDGPPADPEGLGCAGILSPVDAYSLSSPYALALSLAVQADCRAGVDCSVLDEDWPMTLTLLAEQSDGTEMDRTLLGHYLYPGEAIYDGDALMPVPQKALVASMNPTSVIQFLFRAWQNGWQVRLLASLEQGGQTQVASLDIPQLRPLPDTIQFGEAVLTVDPDAQLTLVPSASSACAQGDVEVEGTYLMPLSLDGQQGNVPVSGSVCVALNASGDVPANMVVTQGEVPFTDAAVLPLPPMHRMVSNITLLGLDFGRPATALPYILVFPPPEDGETNPYSVYEQVLTAETLPFGYRIDGARLTEQGIELDYSGTQLLAHGLYDADDSRQTEYLLNSAMFANGQSGTLILKDAGMETTTQFDAGSALSGWPQGQLAWEAFGATINNSRLAHSTLDVSFLLSQSADCRAPGCAQGVGIVHGGTGTALALGSDGSVLGSLSNVYTQGVAWGVRSEAPLRIGGNDYAWRRPDDLTDSDSATLQLPGFLAPADGSVVAHLISHRQRQAQAIVPHGPRSPAFRRGNYYPPGMTFGPEIYADAAGQPDTGDGQAIGNRTLEVDFGNDLLPVITHAASKYVLRNGGVTGVFNADPAQLPDTVSIYGYPIGFDRFAVRLEDNALDTYSWVDGGIELAGDAGFPVSFESLAIDCGGQLGAATLAGEQCDGDCQLASWRADTRLFDFRFTNASGQAAPQCSVSDQKLTLKQEADFLALNKPLLLDVTWSPAGMVERSVLQNQAQYRLDATEESEGFPVALTEAELLTPWDDADQTPARYGTVALGGRIGVPFWQALESDIRLANALDLGIAEAAPSVPLPRNTLIGTTPPAALNQTNRDLLIDWAEDEQFKQYDLTARYEWGSTGFGFGLPVYYDLGESVPEPQFLGRRWDQDLFVLTANAGIDFITPERTKLSFGASADFDRLQNVRFQVDLNSLQSLSKVDDLLISLSLTQEPVIEPVLNEVSTRVEAINAFSQQGIDTLMAEALLLGIEQVGEASRPLMPDNQEPFDLLAASMTQIRGYPDQLIARLDEEVVSPIDDVLEQQETALRAPLQDLLSELQTATPTDTVPGAVFTHLDSAIITVDRSRDQLSALLDPIDQAVAEANTGLAQMERWLDQGEQAVLEINRIAQRATEFASAQCTTQGSSLGTEVDGFLHSAWQHMGNLRAVLSVLEGGELLGFLADSVISDPETQRSMREARRTLAQNAEYLLTQLSAAEQAVRTELCATDIDLLLARVSAFTQATQDELTALRTELFDVAASDLAHRLNDLSALAQTLENDVLAPLDAFSGSLMALRTQLAAQSTYEAVDLTEINQQLFAGTGGRITVLLETASAGPGDVDVFSFVFDGARSEIGRVRSDLVTALQALLQGPLPMANMSADQWRRHLVGQIMAAGPVRALRETLNTELTEVQRQLRDDLTRLADQVNHGIREAVASVESEVNSVLADATAPVRDIPLTSATLDGYGIIAGHELERAHLEASWTMQPSSDGEEGNTFGASLSAVSWSASNKSENDNCSAPGADSNLDVTIAAMNLPARVAGSDITLKKVYLGFTLANAAGGETAFNPIGVYGGLSVLGDIGFSQFVIYDPAFAAGLGAQEVYLGASAGAVFSDIQAEVAFLAGKTCNGDVLMELDPEVAQFIPIPDTGFTGAYVRGSASIPVFTTGCALTIGVSADMGSWVLAGPPLTLGGLVGGGAYGKVLCIGALRGQIKALASVNTDGDITFVGEGFGVAGAGFCEPASWTSVSRSRRDSWCATGDARFQAGYQNGWSIMDLSTSAVH
ncbi:MAG: Calx-beta domain-containing protein [Saccharospirillum sp.]